MDRNLISWIGYILTGKSASSATGQKVQHGTLEDEESELITKFFPVPSQIIHRYSQKLRLNMNTHHDAMVDHPWYDILLQAWLRWTNSR